MSRSRFRVGHISDLHIFRMEDVTPLMMANKRLVGGLNLLLHRSNAHSQAVVERALERIEVSDVDHICITGDLTNLALPSEFAAAKEVVESIPKATERVSVVPGNHDYYTFEAQNQERFKQYFRKFLTSDLPQYQEPSGFPFVHLRENIAIIGVNSAVATAPMLATGTVRDNELRALKALLDDPALKDHFKLVMIHHPLTPYEHAKTDRLRRLTNASEVLNIIRHGEVDLAIHGHNHHFSVQQLPHLKGDGNLLIVEAGSTSNSQDIAPNFAGTFNIFEIEDGRLHSIETCIYDGFEDAYVHWNEFRVTHDFTQ